LSAEKFQDRIIVIAFRLQFTSNGKYWTRIESLSVKL